MESLIKEIEAVEKQITKEAEENKILGNPENSTSICNQMKKCILSDGTKNVTNEFQWLNLHSPIELLPAQEQVLVKKLVSTEWTKVKYKKKNQKPKKIIEETSICQDEKLERLLYQTEYQYNSRKKKKEKRKTEWELSSILESFCITEQSSASMQVETTGISENSKIIKKKKKKLKDRREKKGLKIDEKPKLVTRIPQKILVDENDFIQPTGSTGSGRPCMTHKEKQKARSKFRNKIRKQRDRAENRKNKGFAKDEQEQEYHGRGQQTKGISVELISRSKKLDKLPLNLKKNSKKLNKVMESLNRFSVLE